MVLAGERGGRGHAGHVLQGLVGHRKEFGRFSENTGKALNGLKEEDDTI